MHILGCRQHHVDSHLHHKARILQQILCFLSIRNPINREKRSDHTAWSPPHSNSIILLGGGKINATDPSGEIVPDLTAEIVPGFGIFQDRQRRKRSPLPCLGNTTFALHHSGWDACGIPDGETIVMAGGRYHSYVTRCILSLSLLRLLLLLMLMMRIVLATVCCRFGS